MRPKKCPLKTVPRLRGLSRWQSTGGHQNASSAFTVASLLLFRDDLRASCESATWIPENVRLHQRANTKRRRRHRLSLRDRLRARRRMVELGLKKGK
jgi:hypothetical protein